jgi:molybdate transport system ATP-binding protein
MTLQVAITARLGAFDLDVNFAAPKGVTVLFGPSGAGKSSLLAAVAGLVRPDHGRITVHDRVLFDAEAGINLPAHKRRFGVIFQDGRLFAHMTVLHNLTYGRRFAPPNARAPRLEDVVDLLGIAALLPRRPAALSGGERQRVAIGRALLSAPDMILADEPLAALDDARRNEILPYFEALQAAALVPMLYVSHSVSEVARLANLVVAMQQGRVVATGTAGEIFGRPDIMGAGASALLAAKFVRQHLGGLCEYETGAGPIFVQNWAESVSGGQNPRQVHLRIAAQDVMLATHQPVGISALNILSGTICALKPTDGGAVMVTLHTGQAQILARITQRSAQAMGLSLGQRCFAIVKSVALAHGAAF